MDTMKEVSPGVWLLRRVMNQVPEPGELVRQLQAVYLSLYHWTCNASCPNSHEGGWLPKCCGPTQRYTQMTAPLSAGYQVFATLEYATALVCTHVSASGQICTFQLPEVPT